MVFRSVDRPASIEDAACFVVAIIARGSVDAALVQFHDLWVGKRALGFTVEERAEIKRESEIVDATDLIVLVVPMIRCPHRSFPTE